MPYTDVFGGSAVQPSQVEYSAIALSANIDTFWPSYATTGQVLARIMKVTASAGSLTISLPDATLVGVGQDVLFDNAGANTFTVLDYDGNTVATVAAGQVKYLYLSDNSTAAGVWRITIFGVGSSVLDASQLIGNGIKAIGATLNQSMPQVSDSVDQTVDTTYRAKIYTNTGPSVTYDLGLSATVGNDFFFAVRNQGTGILTLAPGGGELIDGLASVDLQLDESCFVVAGTGEWYTVGRGRNSQFNFTQLSKTVTGGTVTLSLSEASNVLQNYSGTLLSNCTVVLPAVVQVYYISNTTAGAYSLTFQSPTPGSTFVLPTGQSAVVFCNGVDVTNTTTTVSGVTSLLLGAGSVSNPTLALSAANNGLYAPSTSSVAVTNAGTEAMRWSSGQGLAASGTAAAPSYSFISSASSGMYRAGADIIGFATGGAARMSIGATGHVLPAVDATQNLGSGSYAWNDVYGTTFYGAGTGLTGTAAALNIGGNAATATAATDATNAANASYSTTQSPGTSNTTIATTAFAGAAATKAPATYLNAITEYNGVGDGATDNATPIVNACAAGTPVYVPKAASFYATSTLSEADRALLWGPGIIKVVGVETPIAPYPTLTSTTQGVMNLKRATHAPTNNTTNGSVGLGVVNTQVTRSGGYGQYGNWLTRYLVTAAVPATQFDVGVSTWVTMTNLTGGQAFAKWSGANTPAVNLGQTYSGGAVVGDEINVGNRWANFGIQYDVGGTRYTVGQQIVPDVLPSEDGVNTITCTITAGTPGLVNLTAHGFTANMGVVFGGGGTLPTEITPGVVHYVSATGLAANTFSVSLTLGGAAMNFAAGSSGTVNVLPSYPGSFGQALGSSIWGHQWWVGTLIRGDTICAGGIAHIAKGGSVAAGKPAFWLQLRGHWARGIDFTTATLADNIALQLSAGHVIYYGTASMSGSGTGSVSISTGGTGNTGILYADNFSVAPLQWKKSGGASALGFFGTAPVVRTSGFGTPTNGAIQPSFDANTITHADLAKAFAHWVNYFNSLGLTAV